mgnify:CR=1 FL=1
MSERITIKSQREIELMRAAGAVVRDTLLLLEKSAAIGMTTEELNKIAEDFIRSQGAIPSFLNYEGYPKSICTSVNEQVVHGIPGGYKLKDGDIISVDVGAILNGYHGDAARTILIGNVKDEVKQLVEVTRECFFRGMEQAVAGNHIADIGAAVATVLNVPTAVFTMPKLPAVAFNAGPMPPRSVARLTNPEMPFAAVVIPVALLLMPSNAAGNALKPADTAPMPLLARTNAVIPLASGMMLSACAAT